MELRDVRYFVAVAECRSISAAARRTFLSQPALTAAVQRLERDVGVQLLVRTASGVQVSAAGRRFLPAARDLIDQAWRAVDAARDGSAPRDGIRVGWLDGLPRTSLHGAATALRSRQVHVAVVPWLPWDADGVRTGVVDIAPVFWPVAEDELDLLPLGTQPRGLGVGPASPFYDARDGEVSVADFDGMAILNLHRFAPSRWIDAWSFVDELNGSRLPVVGDTVRSFDDAIACVRHAGALSFPPRFVADAYRAAGLRFIELVGTPARLDLCFRRDCAPAVRFFAETVRSEFRQASYV